MKKLLILSVAFLGFSYPTFAQWNSNPAINSPICTDVKNQQNFSLVSDGKGGAIVTWEDSKNSLTAQTDIYVQRIDKNGFIKWSLNGISVCGNSSDQAGISLTADGSSGAIIAWTDSRNGDKDIYAQKVDSNGVMQWSANGISVCTKTGVQNAPKIISDGSGGGILVWQDSTLTGPDIYSQRISSSGTLLWTVGGVAVCTNSFIQKNPRIITDSIGGAIIVWQDDRNGNDYDIYIQRLNPLGIALWTSQGVVLCNAIGTQNNPKLKPDGDRGAIVAWVDNRGTDHDIYAQRIDSLGVTKWTANGVVICNATGSQSAIALTSSGINGAILAWKDSRSVTSEDVYAQKINLNGTVAWTSNGVAIATGSQPQKNASIAGDGNGGAIIVWQDSIAGSWSIYSQKINSTGTSLWTANGVATGTAASDQTSPDNVSDGNGGSIFVWQDARNLLDEDIYAHHFNTNGLVSGIYDQLVFTESNLFPNPFNNTATLNLKNAGVALQDLQLKFYDIYGNEVHLNTVHDHDVFIINRNGFADGIYFYVIQKDSTIISRGKFFLVN